jgi:putative transcriptional regulator
LLHAGGPVERSSFLGLALWAGREPGDPVPEWWTPIRHGIGLVNLAADPDEARDLEALRIYHGYAGWGAGQLDAEIGEDAWFVVDAHSEDPFTDRPDRLWNAVLARQRGSLALYGNYPADAHLN